MRSGGLVVAVPFLDSFDGFDNIDISGFVSLVVWVDVQFQRPSSRTSPALSLCAMSVSIAYVRLGK
jgi:hypothetical protein